MTILKSEDLLQLLQHLQLWKPQKLQLWHVLAQTMRGSAPPQHLSIDNSKLDNYPTLMLTIQILESLKKDSKFWEVYMSIYVTVYIEIYIYTYILYISKILESLKQDWEFFKMDMCLQHWFPLLSLLGLFKKRDIFIRGLCQGSIKI